MHSPYNPTKFSPSRTDRDLDRGRAEFERTRAETGSAHKAALAWIGATFNGSGTHSIFKDRTQRWIEAGAADTEVRLRFGRLARAFLTLLRPEDAELGWCIGVLNRSWSDNREIMRRNAMWRGGGVNDHHPAALAEARLILRWLRMTHRSHLWPSILATVSGQVEHVAPRTVFIADGRSLQAAE